MQVDQASEAERLLRELCAEFEPLLTIELDGLAEHAAAPEAFGVQGTWPGPGTARVGGEAAWAVPGVHEHRGAAGPHRVSLISDPGAEVAALTAALRAAAAQDPASLPEPQALARTRALLEAAERLKALSLQALADVETRTLHALDDAPSVNAWESSLSVPGVDQREIALARRLGRVPQILTEMQAGRMSSRTAAVLATAVAKARPFLDRSDGMIDGFDGEQVLEGVLVDGVGSLIAEQVGGAADAADRLAVLGAEMSELNDATRPQLTRWEAALVVFARESDPALLPSGIAILVDALLPHEHEKRAHQADHDRGLDLHRNHLGSGWHVKGDLDDETGEMLATVLEAAAATDPAAPDDTLLAAGGRQALGDDTLPPHQWPADQPAPRSRRQQRHDAFTRGLKALLDHGALGVRGKATPHVAVTVPHDFLDGVPGSLPARAERGTRFSRTQVRRLLCRSTFTRLVLDAQRRVMEVSHSQRTSTALERLVLKVQGGAVCSGAGCARGPATGHRLIPHHGSLFRHTGTTELADTVLLCEPDHDHELHAQGRHLTLKDGRVLGPDGWVRR